MKTPYQHCEFFADISIGDTFHLLGQPFRCTGETSIEAPDGSAWRFDAATNEIQPEGKQDYPL